MDDCNIDGSDLRDVDAEMLHQFHIKRIHAMKILNEIKKLLENVTVFFCVVFLCRSNFCKFILWVQFFLIVGSFLQAEQSRTTKVTLAILRFLGGDLFSNIFLNNFAFLAGTLMSFGGKLKKYNFLEKMSKSKRCSVMENSDAKNGENMN